MVKESPRWLWPRDHINEVIARLAYIFCLGPIRSDIAEIEIVITEQHEGDVRQCPPAVEWIELGRLLRTADLRRGTSRHGIAAPDDSCRRLDLE